MSLMLSAFAAPVAAQPPAATTSGADVAGSWDVMFNTAQGSRPALLKVTKNAGKLTGTISSDMGETPVDVTVKDKALTVTFTFQGENGAMSILMTGTVDGDAMKGTANADGNPIGDWAATRAKDSKAGTEPKETTKASADMPSAAKVDLTGTWNVSLELPSMTASPTITLKQDGEKLTGQYISEQYGQFPLTGTIKGNEVAWSFAIDIQGTVMNVNYAGKADKDQITGAANYGDMMSGTFTATKKK